jgi:hypothetical protein
MNTNNNDIALRVIQTARDLESINEAASSGFKPLIKKLEPSGEIRTKYCVVQHAVTGKIEVLYDYRSDIDPDFEIVIDWSFYYPYHYKSPYAAYLIPIDIKIGERVILEDLIEDYAHASWNQGDTYRLKSCEAIWNGKTFDIQFKPKQKESRFIG